MSIDVKYFSLGSRAIASNFWNWLYKLRHNEPIFKALLYKCALQATRKFRCDCPAFHLRAIASNFWNWLYKLRHNEPIFKALLYKCSHKPLENLDAIDLRSIYKFK